MYRPASLATCALVALALTACSGASSPVEPSVATARQAGLATADSTVVSTTSTGEEGVTERGVYTLGGGN